jgi:hypothetical protein
MSGTLGELLVGLWRAASFLAPRLRRLFRHPWFFRWHGLSAIILLEIFAMAGFGLWILIIKISPHNDWWQLVALLPLVLPLSYLRMVTEKPKIPLLTIEEALASETEGDFFHPLGRIAWSQVSGLTRRAEAEAIIQKWDRGAKALLLTGYSASGKSAIAAMVGQAIVNRGSRLLPSFVYYVNLTNQREAPPGAEGQSILECISQALGMDEPFAGSLVYCIVEDAHHEIEKIGDWNWLLEKRGWRVLLTSRPPEGYVFRGSQAARAKENPFYWLSAEHRLALATDEKIVGEIVSGRKGVTCGGLEAVLDFISSGSRFERKEPNLLLLDCALHAAREPEKPLEEVCTPEAIRDYLARHWEALAQRLEIDDKMLFSILCPLSVISEFEVPVSQSFAARSSGKAETEVAKALEALVKDKAVVRVKTGDVRGQNYFLLPHARLARVQRELWVREQEREDTLAGYIGSEPFIGTLTLRLQFEDEECWRALLEKRTPDVLQRSLDCVPLDEIGDFLLGVTAASAPLAAQIVKRHKEELLGKSLAQASLREICGFLQGVARASEPLAAQVAEQHKGEIGKALAQASLGEIGGFLLGVWAASAPLAAQIAEQHKEEILGKSLAQASLGEIREFLWRVVRASEDLGKQVAEQHKEEILGKSLAQASLGEIGNFLWAVARASEPLAAQIAKRDRQAICEVYQRSSSREQIEFKRRLQDFLLEILGLSRTES